VSTAPDEPRPARTSRPRPTGTDARRWPIAAVLVVLLAAALVAGNADADDDGGEGVRRDARGVVALADGSARSSAWYCPGPPPTGALDDSTERIRVANVGDADADVAVTVLPDGDAPALRNTLAVPARTGMPIETEGDAVTAAAVIVEPFAPQVVVEAVNTGDARLAATPCPTQPSSTWHFAIGTTVRGAEQWIVLFNPFGDDAIVDLSFFTDTGFELPDALQGLTVPRRSRVAVPVHDTVRRQRAIGTTIRARTGRIVAQQTIVFGPDSGRSGTTRSLGAVEPADQWVFPSGRTANGSVRTLSITNPDDLDAEVDISIAPSADIVIEPLTVRIARRGIATVQLGSCGELRRPACVPIPRDVAYSTVVRATLDVPVVAEDLVTYTTGRFTGTAGGTGSDAAARTWVFARSRVNDTIGSGIDLLTTGSSAASVDVSFVVDGREITPPRLQGVELRPGVRESIPLEGRRDLRGLDAAVVVRADRPIVAERTIVREDELTRDLGIPAAGG
jgi:hypothetical protein